VRPPFVRPAAIAMNKLHPIFHAQSHHAGSRLDIERILPHDISSEDIELLLEDLSEPPRYQERLAPVGMQIGEESVRGKNFTDMLVKAYRHFARIYAMITMSIEQALRNNFRERGMVPFSSLGLDIDFLHRVIEVDQAISENTYGRIMDLFKSGIMSPCITIPFHPIVPMLRNEFDIRMCVRTGLLLYWPLVRKYNEYINRAHEEDTFSACIWLPEGGIDQRTLEILYDEFMTCATEEGHNDPHLVILLDNHQIEGRDKDTLMKAWNTLRVREGKDEWVSVVCRDRFFSDWVTYSNPSVKKLLDRTIAKVDSELNISEVDYGWAHFEDIEALGLNGKAALNFEQKMIKLTELSYLPYSPDIFVRRKRGRKLGMADHEPIEVTLNSNTGWSDWHMPNVSLGRWDGTLSSHDDIKLVDENRPYVRRARMGRINEQGYQCWKLALNRARDAVADAALGDPETMTGGALGVLAGLVPSNKPDVVRRNVLSFLVNYAHIHWREHFIEHDMSEADIQLYDIASEHLLASCKGATLDEENAAIAGVTAQAYYFMLDSYRSHGNHAENVDQRATYQNVVMAALSVCNLVYVHHWQGNKKTARELLDVMSEHFFDFENAYDRYRLFIFGVTRDEWKDAIKSEVYDDDRNIVLRGARRVAARHLRPLGYKKEFSEEDEHLSTNTGHLWTAEIENSNYRWENKLFCGVREE
jgi:hypothetical protein